MDNDSNKVEIDQLVEFAPTDASSEIVANSPIDPLLASIEPWSVDLDLEESVCYALAHNHVPILRSMKIRANTGAQSKKLTIRFRGKWANQDRSPIRDSEIVIDAPTPGEPVELSPVSQLQLDDIALSDLAESANAYLTIEIVDDVGRKQSIQRDLRIFSRSQWLGNPRMMVVTAAFVQPNHPDVPSILDRASKILIRSGRPGSISGYQGVETGQHHAIAEAIFYALQERIPTYINPPASFEQEGQKLRPLDEVLENGQGTCIDLACAYASCLEQAGLHPVIYRVPGHAFAGYLTKEMNLNSSLVANWTEIQSLMDSGLLVGVETTGIPGKMEFAQAVAATSSHFAPGGMHSVLDVSRAHREGIRPLPARVVRGGEIIVVIDGGNGKPPIIERRDPTTRKLLPESVPARVQSWKSSLLDLSFRNRLLNLNPSRHGVEILPPLGSLGWIEDRLNNGDPLIINAADNLNEVQKAAARNAQQLNKELLEAALFSAGILFGAAQGEVFKRVASRMRNDARNQEEETGANCLYLGLGSVQWGSQYGDYESPLFLVPVRIAPIRGLYAIQIQMDDTQSTVINYCLIEALRMREQLQLQWFSDDMSDDLGLDVEAGLEAMRTEFRERGLEARGFSVNQSASLAILDFKKFRLWKDLNDYWKEFAQRPVVKHLIDTPGEAFADPAAASLPIAVNDSKILCAQPADGSQIAAIERALAGSSFVLEGPPGTGKSQTITNLLANAMNRGQKVLFVAEKQAALSVVRERLDQVGLGPYCLDLHDKGSKPQVLREQLLQALDQSPNVDERQVAQFEDDFVAAAALLDNYRNNVYGANNAGFSFASAYFRLLELGSGPAADIPRSILDLPLEEIDKLRRATIDLESFTTPAKVAPWHPWLLVGSSEFSLIDRNQTSTDLQQVIQAALFLNGVVGEIAAVIQQIRTANELSEVATLVTLLESGLSPSSQEWASIFVADWPESSLSSIDEMSKILESVGALVAKNPSILLDQNLSETAAAIKTASESFALGRKGRIKNSLGIFSTIFSEDSLDQIVTPKNALIVAQASANLRQAYDRLKKKAGFTTIEFLAPTSAKETEILRERVELLRTISIVASNSGDLGTKIRSLLGSIAIPQPGVARTLTDLAKGMASLTLSFHISDETMTRWSGENGLIDAVRASSSVWTEAISSGTYLSLQRWMNLINHLDQFRNAGLNHFAEAIESAAISGFDASQAFERGLLNTTLQVRAEETDLDVFDSDQQNRRVRKFIELLDQRKLLAQSLIPYNLFRNRKISGGITTGKVGEFRRELNTPRRGRGKSIRHLIQKYPEIVSDLTPCFMMSPDSVAQFIPPGSIKFDLVVFDEASQITVADAIGVLGRSNACVIVGDSQQMPPSRIGVAGSGIDEDEEENENENLDEVSILKEAVKSGFEKEMLSWHYRSQDESLISFSNDHYYESRLSTFPAPVDVRTDCGVFYRRVDGQFDHGKTRTNDVEARAIVEEIISRLDSPLTTDLSIGVVTLNIQQRNLVESYLDSSKHPKIKELRETEDTDKRLFVLNLESVQGRERDIIVMGTSFSKRVGGAAMPLNFGPLTNADGEKRLNVAVTRARRQFVVVTSFDPEEMSGATSLGMVHLREYLQHAARRGSGRPEIDSSKKVINQQALQIASRLEERGIKVLAGLGASKFKIDLALSLPELDGRWLVAVLIDSAEWSQRPLVVDRDALPVTILEKVMGWPRVARVWMPAWRIEPDRVIEELVELVNAAKLDPKSIPEQPPVEVPRFQIDVESIEEEGLPLAAAPSAKLPNEEPFVAFVGAVYDDQQALNSLSHVAKAMTRELVETEGPMDALLAIKKIAYQFGMKKVVTVRANALYGLLSDFTITEIGDSSYVWPSDKSEESWRGFRRSDSNSRDLSAVSPYEIVNAMESLIRESISIERTELVRWTGNFFGFNRLTARVSEYVNQCLNWGISTQRIIEEDGYLTINS